MEEFKHVNEKLDKIVSQINKQTSELKFTMTQIQHEGAMKYIDTAIDYFNKYMKYRGSAGNDKSLGDIM